MNNQGSTNEPRSVGKSRYAAIAPLVLIGVVLFFLGTAHQCIGRDWTHLTDGDGNYWGSTTMFGGPGEPHVSYIEPRTGGNEFCFPDTALVSVDWEWGWVFGLGSEETTPGVVSATANGEGGYAEGFFDCMDAHQLWWGAQWKWKEHGTEKVRSANACLVLGGPDLCASSIF